MRLNSTPDPPSNRTTLSFNDDEVKEALITYAKVHRIEFDLHTDDRIIVVSYQAERGYDRNCTQIIIDREGSLAPPIRKLKRGH